MSKHQRASDFIGDLCIALAHRWEPERPFMILTAYFDESGTHSDAEISCMAGFLGNARQWRKFEKRAGKLFKRFRVDVFHTIDVRRTDKDFEGWKVDRKIEFLDEFQHIINETLEEGVSSFITQDDYAYYRNLKWPKKARPDSKYTILFRACLAHSIRGGPLMSPVIEPSLNIVLEDGHANAGDALRVYNLAKERLGQSKALAGLTFGNKKTSLPLAAADLFAYTAWGKEVGQKPIGVAKKPIKADLSYRRNMFRVVVDRNNLEGLYDQAMAFATDQPSSSEGRRPT
jgi:hypothetical protein